MQPAGVLETCLYTSDLEAVARFYADVLGLTVIKREPGRHVFFRCGPGVLLVFDPAATECPEGDIPPHGARGPGHLALAVAAADLPAWRDRLAAHGVAIEHEETWGGRGHSLYFRDPAGNSLELATPSLWELPEPPA